MQLKLIRKWGQLADYYVLAFDDDQTLYGFIGATPSAILDAEIPEDHKVILRQSYRLPRAIHQFADVLIHRVSRRQEKGHLHRPFDGAVHRLSGTYKSPEYGILPSAAKHLRAGKTIMFLTSCGYVLEPLIQVLRKSGIAFHNPYRKSDGFWNPLRLGKKTAARRMLALLVAHPGYGVAQRGWTFGDLQLWTEWLSPAGIMQLTANDFILAADKREVVRTQELAADLFAVNFLVSQAKLDKFVARVHPLYSKLKISAFANSNEVHPGIVVGQLQHRKKIAYADSRDLLVKVRNIIIACALTDGWGSTV